MLITNSPELANYAEDCGVARIFIDLEVNGKKERQGHLDTLISQHSIKDISLVKKSIKKAELLVRLNPLHEHTQIELDQVIESGADLVMLPMFKTAADLKLFSNMVAGRAGIVPLVETYSALKDMSNIVDVTGLSEIYIGLNDLHLDMGLSFMFEPLANGLIDTATDIIKRANLPFGFGGVARVGEGDIPGELVLAEHVRLGSNSVILSRTFHKSGSGLLSFRQNTDLEGEINKLFLTLKSLRHRGTKQVESDRKVLIERVLKVVKLKHQIV
ncbi:aldolase [Candidatus Paraluminiphilus aquimaris]|uniref:Aldolase n=1 Tax=Candidatus Paraluminiphilus aquimaris TaxID=2518994 RepID=A0ABY6QBJ8_9GAMM|nr:aldolase/citrate lyase family protein [Candidatus Paraluminiphilus aquimaris]UZP75573.1 aldolase [Candidatus Paraluminiphilus aquimaris]